jgi:hypothetical protein
VYCRPRHYGAGRLAWTGTINSRFLGFFLNTNLCFFFLFLTLAILVKSSLSNYSTWIFVGIVASHHQVHNKLTTLLILFVGVGHRQSAFFAPRKPLLSSRSIVIAASLRSSAIMPLKTFIKLLQPERLSWKNGSRHQSSTHESKIRQSEVPKDGHVLENASEARPLTILEVLPPELIIYMAQFLPLSSTVLFTLSCHAACAILGTRYWTSLQAVDQHQQHIDFLSQLSKDLPPDYVPCYHCRVLHLCTIRYSDHLPTRPLYQYDLTPCDKAEVLGKVSKYIHKDFQFRTFQMAMKKYRLGLDHEIWLECLCRESTKCRIMQKFPSEFKADARIVDGSLLFRSQRVILIPPGLTIRNLDRCSFNICPHIRLVAHGAEANIPETAECTTNHQHALQRCVRKSGIVPCTACPTEYNLSLEECGGFGVAAIITKWMDLGEGQTILDPKWLSHLSNEYAAFDIFREVDGINGRRLVDRDPVRSNCISIRDSFGQDESSELDPILPLEAAERLFQLPKLPV